MAKEQRKMIQTCVQGKKFYRPGLDYRRERKRETERRTENAVNNRSWKRKYPDSYNQCKH